VSCFCEVGEHGTVGDVNSNWIISVIDEGDQGSSNQLIKHGSLVRLIHDNTNKYLYSHDEKIQIYRGYPMQYEVGCSDYDPEFTTWILDIPIFDDPRAHK
jgi:dolichyl-phosphate-mannose--protein O-mannosyl transferase